LAAAKLASKPKSTRVTRDSALARIKRIDAVFVAPPREIVGVDNMSPAQVLHFARRAAVLVCANDELVVPSSQPHVFKLHTYFTEAVAVATALRHTSFNARLLSVALQTELFKPPQSLAPGYRYGTLWLTPPLVSALKRIK